MLTNEWQKSSRSSGGTNDACVEARQADQATVQVRDTKLGDASPILATSPADWRGFLTAATK